MLFLDLSEIAGGYEHVYLSPHLDDAALSCGGMIVRQREAGEGVLVVTICTGAPAPEGPFSDLALAFHRAWGLGPAEAVAGRLREDTLAMAALGADSLWVGQLDAIYRHPAAYASRERLFGEPAADDPLLPALRGLVGQLRARLPGAALYAPLGVGCHVDHQITCRAALERGGDRLALYEDFPYVARDGELERRTAALDLALRPRVTAIGEALARKVASVGAYGSQLAELAQSQLGREVSDGDAAAVMAEALADYARRVGGERVWELAAG